MTEVRITWPAFRADPRRYVRLAGERRVVVVREDGRTAFTLSCPDPEAI